MEYAVWRACERFGIRPPKVSASWEECNVMVQSAIVAYDQIRQHEDLKLQAAFAGARI